MVSAMMLFDHLVVTSVQGEYKSSAEHPPTVLQGGSYATLELYKDGIYDEDDYIYIKLNADGITVNTLVESFNTDFDSVAKREYSLSWV
jgi:hypothetical protein